MWPLEGSQLLLNISFLRCKCSMARVQEPPVTEKLLWSCFQFEFIFDTKEMVQSPVVKNFWRLLLLFFSLLTLQRSQCCPIGGMSILKCRSSLLPNSYRKAPTPHPTLLYVCIRCDETRKQLLQVDHQFPTRLKPKTQPLWAELTPKFCCSCNSLSVLITRWLVFSRKFLSKKVKQCKFKMWKFDFFFLYVASATRICVKFDQQIKVLGCCSSPKIIVIVIRHFIF